MSTNELKLQKTITKWLGRRGIYPFSVICTFAIPPFEGHIGITFHSGLDLTELLECLDYKCQCDRSGYVIISEYNTLILSGMALLNLYSKLDD